MKHLCSKCLNPLIFLALQPFPHHGDAISVVRFANRLDRPRAIRVAE